jgi:hypothetical protein
MIFRSHYGLRQVLALACISLIAPGGVPLLKAQQLSGAEKPKLKSADQLDSLVAPIALYPDPLLAQVLAAATYPLEIVQAHRWLKANSKLTGENLTTAAAKQPWDASVQALVAFPSALKLLDENIQWTTDLGNAFLDQQSDVMDAVQRMRKKAKDSGKLETTKEQKVEVKTIENKTIVEIRPADPQVIYVPTYNPIVVYGPPVYAYPPIYYPPYTTGAVVATAAISFGVGVMMGAFWGGCCGGGWGWGCGWGGNHITINNNFHNRYGYANISGGDRTNIRGGDRVAARGGNTWQHNPDHRRSVPYSDRGTAQRFGGSVRDTSGRMERFDRSGQSRAALDRGTQASTRDLAGTRDRSGVSNAGRQDRMGNRSIGSDAGRKSAFGGSESPARSQAASNRGFSSSRQSSFGSSSGRSSFSSGSGRSGGGRSFGGGGRRR